MRNTSAACHDVGSRLPIPTGILSVVSIARIIAPLARMVTAYVARRGRQRFKHRGDVLHCRPCMVSPTYTRSGSCVAAPRSGSSVRDRGPIL